MRLGKNDNYLIAKKRDINPFWQKCYKQSQYKINKTKLADEKVGNKGEI